MAAKKKVKPKCDKCSVTTSVMTRKGYDEKFCYTHMLERVKNEIVDNVDDMAYKFDHLFDWDKGSTDTIVKIENILMYEDLNTVPLMGKLKERFKEGAVNYIWYHRSLREFMFMCRQSRGICGLCGNNYPARSYMIKTIAKNLCDNCLSMLADEIQLVSQQLKEDKRNDFIKDVKLFIASKHYSALGPLIEQRFNCAKDVEDVKKYLSKLIIEGEFEPAIVKKMEKSNYYKKHIQPIIDELNADDE